MTYRVIAEILTWSEDQLSHHSEHVGRAAATKEAIRQLNEAHGKKRGTRIARYIVGFFRCQPSGKCPLSAKRTLEALMCCLSS
jgi:hypothetical protein